MLVELAKLLGVPTLIVVFGAVVWERLREIPRLRTQTDALIQKVSRLEGMLAGQAEERSHWD